MTATMQPCDTVAKAGSTTASPNRRRWIKTSRVAQSLAAFLGKSEHYVEKMIRARTGLNIRVAELIRVMRAVGADAQLERFYSPIRRAYENRHPQPLTLKLVESASDACHAEHIAELRYLMSRSDADLSLDIRATERALLQMTLLHDAQLAEEQRRMQGQS